jgi:hypothetical protein
MKLIGGDMSEYERIVKTGKGLGYSCLDEIAADISDGSFKKGDLNTRVAERLVEWVAGAAHGYASLGEEGTWELIGSLAESVAIAMLAQHRADTAADPQELSAICLVADARRVAELISAGRCDRDRAKVALLGWSVEHLDGHATTDNPDDWLLIIRLASMAADAMIEQHRSDTEARQLLRAPAQSDRRTVTLNREAPVSCAGAVSSRGGQYGRRRTDGA